LIPEFKGISKLRLGVSGANSFRAENQGILCWMRWWRWVAGSIFLAPFDNYARIKASIFSILLSNSGFN
jgi:hypothetical protein